jgi:hypothetical protein
MRKKETQVWRLWVDPIVGLNQYFNNNFETWLHCCRIFISKIWCMKVYNVTTKNNKGFFIWTSWLVTFPMFSTYLINGLFMIVLLGPVVTLKWFGLELCSLMFCKVMLTSAPTTNVFSNLIVSSFWTTTSSYAISFMFKSL